MYPATIDHYLAPNTLQQALEALSIQHDGDAMCIAGGMSLMQAMKSRLVRPKTLVDLQHLPGINSIQFSSDAITIGAMARYAAIARETRLHGAYEALNDAARHVGDRQVRNRGTLGGSLCWNYLAACCPPACLALGAEIELASLDDKKSQRTRRIAIGDFLKGPLETARRPDELMLSIRLPAPPRNAGSAYKKWGLVTDAFPVVGVAVYVEVNASGACTVARVAVGGLASGPKRAASAEKALAGKGANEQSAIAAAFQAAARELDVQADLWASQDSRRMLIQELGVEVTHTAFQRATGQK